jgi:SAM-dependent methyltransferase
MQMKDTERAVQPAKVDREQLRQQIQAKYTDVALEPEQGFHFHTGRPLAGMLGYSDADVDALPASAVESFAGTGNPFSLGALDPGEAVLDIGCGAGFDTLIAARQVGPTGSVIAVDMTEAMLTKTRAGAQEVELGNVEARLGYAEALPVQDESIDVVISNASSISRPTKSRRCGKSGVS